jgi:hypothetical protein
MQKGIFVCMRRVGHGDGASTHALRVGRIPSPFMNPPYIFPSLSLLDAKTSMSLFFELHFLVPEQVRGARIYGLRRLRRKAFFLFLVESCIGFHDNCK